MEIRCEDRQLDDLCPGDLNGDGLRGTPDLVIFLAHFGEVSTNGCSPVGDLNFDGGVTTPDLVAFLADFGTPCPPSDPSGQQRFGAPQAMVGGGPQAGSALSLESLSGAGVPGPVIAALGFPSTAAYQAYLDSLTPEELGTHVLDVLRVIESLGLK